MAIKSFSQNFWSGGLSDSIYYGVKGSIAEGVGIDIHSEPGVINVSQALKKDSGATVDTLPLFAVNASSGASYWFGDSAAIKKRLANGTWSSIATGLAAAGAVLGACEWMGYIYWATAVKLHKIKVSDDTVTLNIQILDTASWHPMVRQGLYLVIGNATKFATIDDTGTFTASGTPDIVNMEALPSYLQISCLEKFQTDVIAGTIADDTHSASLYRWDTVSPQWVDTKNIPENGVNALVPVDTYLVIQAGNQGQFYYYDGTVIEKYRKISGTYGSSVMQTYPGSVCVFKGIALVGISNSSGNPCLEGVYSIGQHDNTYPLATMLEYVPSPNITSGLQVGAMLSVGNATLLVAWKKEAAGGTYGVDVIDYSNKYSSAYFKTLAITGDEETNKTFQEYVITYKTLPTSTSLALTYDVNFAGTFVGTITLNSESSYNKYQSRTSFEANVAQFKVAFTVSANTAPSVRKFYCEFNERPQL